MYKPTNKRNWVGRIDENEGVAGYRWHQVVKIVDLDLYDLPAVGDEEIGIAILGFACDEGVRRNKGRVGAKEGPELLRKVCSNLANHFSDDTKVYDVGDVICDNHDLESAQKELESLITRINQKGYFVFVIGGGHEMAFPHFMGIRNSIEKEKSIGIINIDAHFDLRLPEDSASSGTPFYQIADYCQNNNIPFHYLVAGIQPSANTKALFKRAEDYGVTHILISVLNTNSLESKLSTINQFIEHVDHVYLTICLDVFDISVAPGVSAPSAIGLQPQIALEIISEIVSSGKLITADIAELNPSLDRDDKTAKLASKLVFEILTNYRKVN